jgi:hypothetical protein
LAFFSRSEQEKELEEEAVVETTGANTSEEAAADGAFFKELFTCLFPICC